MVIHQKIFNNNIQWYQIEKLKRNLKDWLCKNGDKDIRYSRTFK